jgi:hypothetical protein
VAAPLARLGLPGPRPCRATSLKKAAHQDFLTIGEVADPDIPVLIAAKSEYAKLKWRAYLFSGYR